MKTPIIVIDEFFETPSLVRSYGLQQEFFKGDRGNWPGLRTEFISEFNKELFHTIASKLMYYLPGKHTFTHLECGFQIIDETYGSGWVHDDDHKFNVAGIIYLNPDNIPDNSGTTFYDHRLDVNGEDYSNMFRSEVNAENVELRNEYKKYRDEHRSKWKPNTIVENRYNRCVMFDSTLWHSADNFFGTDMDNSRLTIVFFGHAI